MFRRIERSLPDYVVTKLDAQGRNPDGRNLFPGSRKARLGACNTLTAVTAAWSVKTSEVTLIPPSVTNHGCHIDTKESVCTTARDTYRLHGATRG
jgi:hypothetical protein